MEEKLIEAVRPHSYMIAMVIIWRQNLKMIYGYDLLVMPLTLRIQQVFLRDQNWFLSIASFWINFMIDNSKNFIKLVSI